MILGYSIQKVKDRDVVDVKDLKLSKMCLNCLSDNPPFKTALYKGKQWDYLCILENSIYLELVNIKTETLYLNPRLKEVVLKEGKISFSKLNTAVQDLAELSQPHKTDILYNNIMCDSIPVIIDTFNRSDNGNELILISPKIIEGTLNGEIKSSKKVFIITNDQGDEIIEILERQSDSVFRDGMRSIPLGVRFKESNIVTVFTGKEVTPAMAMAITHILRGIK